MPIGLASAVLAAGAVAVAHQEPPSAARVAQGFDVQLPVAPLAVDSGGRVRLAYELHLTSFADGPVRLERLQVSDQGGRPVAALDGERLRLAMGPVGQPPSDHADGTVTSGRRVVLYIDIDTDAAPASIAHRLTYEERSTSSTRVLDLGAVALDRRAAAVLGPPLRGSAWLAAYAPEMARGHRRVLYATRGRARLPGRFAIDFFRLDAQGRNARGSVDEPANWLGHGADVLAVADAVVAATRDGVDEPVRFRGAPPVAIGDATGNFIALALGDGRYVFYEHLLPGLGVRPGDRVRRGQAIGRVGATGQATGAHLHLHVADALDPLDAEGLPFVLEDATPIGTYPSIDAAFAGAAWTPVAGGSTAPTLPAPNTVLRFPH